MQKIIEEKRRQRTISVGSLDGMVITRDNELIAASLMPPPQPSNCDVSQRPLLNAAVINRISEAVARKMELKMAQNATPTGKGIVGGSKTAVCCIVVLDRSAGVSRARVDLDNDHGNFICNLFEIRHDDDNDHVMTTMMLIIIMNHKACRSPPTFLSDQ